MTRTEHVFGQQAWLRALEGTSLGGAITFALTEGTRPPLPPLEHNEDARSDATPAPSPSARSQRRADRKVRRNRRRKAVRMATGAAHRLPKARRKLRTSGNSVLNLHPLGEALRHGGPIGIRPIDLSLINRPGLQLRLAITALRAGVLRYVTEDGTIVEEDAAHPGPG